MEKTEGEDMLYSNQYLTHSEDDLLRHLANNMAKYPGIAFSSHAILYFNYVARIPEKGELSRPAFPEALAAVLRLQCSDGSIRSHNSIFRGIPFLMAILAVNTLLIWDKIYKDFSKQIRMSLEYILHLIESNQLHPIDYPCEQYGKEYGHNYTAAITIHELFYEYEIELLLINDKEYLNDNQKELLKRENQRFFNKANAMKIIIHDKKQLDVLFKKEFLRFSYIYYFPEYIFSLKSCAEYMDFALREPTLVSVSFAVKFYQEKEDQKSYFWLKQICSNRPLSMLSHLGLTETVFGLWYLTKAGVDLTEKFSERIYQFLAYELPGDGGYPFSSGVPEADAETSAIASAIAHKFNLSIRMLPALYDGWWNEDRKFFRVVNRYIWNVGANFNILNGYLICPEFSFEQKQERWLDVLQTFERAPWSCTHNLSPFYTWECVISIISAHYCTFPRTNTRLHQRALDQILRYQHPSGGFYSITVGKPNVIETAYALLGIKQAIKNRHLFDEMRGIEDIAKRAEDFILKNWIPFTLERFNANIWQPYPEFWITDLTSNVINLDESVIISSLLMKYE